MTHEETTAQVEKYIRNFLESQGEGISMALKDAHLSYQISAARHSDPRLSAVEDIVDDIEGNIGEFYISPIIPNKFPSLASLVNGVNAFKQQLSTHIDYIRGHYDFNNSVIFHIRNVLSICDKLVQFCDEVSRIATETDMPDIYSEIR